jgi:hypothetical protein
MDLLAVTASHCVLPGSLETQLYEIEPVLQGSVSNAEHGPDDNSLAS